MTTFREQKFVEQDRKLARRVQRDLEKRRKFEAKKVRFAAAKAIREEEGLSWRDLSELVGGDGRYLVTHEPRQRMGRERVLHPTRRVHSRDVAHRGRRRFKLDYAWKPTP